MKNVGLSFDAGHNPTMGSLPPDKYDDAHDFLTKLVRKKIHQHRLAFLLSPQDREEILNYPILFQCSRHWDEIRTAFHPYGYIHQVVNHCILSHAKKYSWPVTAVFGKGTRVKQLLTLLRLNGAYVGRVKVTSEGEITVDLRVTGAQANMLKLDQRVKSMRLGMNSADAIPLDVVVPPASGRSELRRRVLEEMKTACSILKLEYPRQVLAYEIHVLARESVRVVAARLGCSTRTVNLYVEEVKKLIAQRFPELRDYINEF